MQSDINTYTRLTHFLGDVLGPDYEIVLHWKDEEDSYYIAAIEHSYISGRDKNSPITGFALQLVRNKTYLQQDYVSGYTAQSEGTGQVRGSTFFIKDSEGGLSGLLCVNFSPGRYVQLSRMIMNLAGMDDQSEGENAGLLSQVEGSRPESTAIEFLHSNIYETISDIVGPYLPRPGVTLTPETRMKIVKMLDEKGIFQIKGALPRVADMLQVSSQTIYRYLKVVERRTR